MTPFFNARDLGRQIKALREAEGWTLNEAAAWLNVGTRFLLELEGGKKTVQLNMALEVATKFGLRFWLQAQPDTSANVAIHTSSKALTPPAGLPAPKSWVSLRYAALTIAKAVGVDAAPVTLEGKNALCTVPVSDSLRIGTLAEWTVANGRQARPAKEMKGGPSFVDILSTIRAHSRHPLPAVQTLVRWLIFSTMIADTEIDIDCVKVAWSSDAPLVFDLLPFERMICCPETMDPMHVDKGLKIHTAWPETYLRADHWVAMATAADVHPKVLFQTMKGISVRIPGLLDQALLDFFGATPIPKQLLPAIKTIRTRADRMSDLTLAAGRQVAGLRTKTQPKLDPVATKLVIEPTRRHTNVLIDDE